MQFTSFGQLPITCECFLQSNYFIDSLQNGRIVQQHFMFSSKEYLQQENKEIFENFKFTEQDIELIIKELQKQYDQRVNRYKDSLIRKKNIKDNYKAIHEDLWILNEDMFDQDFLILNQLINQTGIRQAELPIKIVKSNVYSFKMFNEQFCDKMIKEILNFKNSQCLKSPVGSMSKHSISLDDLGFTKTFSDQLMIQYINPISKILFPQFLGNLMDNHKVYIVHYGTNDQTDLQLSTHYDDSEITLNVNIGDDHQGSEILFYGDLNDQYPFQSYEAYEHKKGWAILHLGSCFHEVLPIEQGQRLNLIGWFRSYQYRKKCGCLMCGNTNLLINPETYQQTD